LVFALDQQYIYDISKCKCELVSKARGLTAAQTTLNYNGRGGQDRVFKFSFRPKLNLNTKSGFKTILRFILV